MLVDFVSQETKEPGRNFPSKLLKQNFLNETSRKELTHPQQQNQQQQVQQNQQDNMFASSNQGQMKAAQEQYQRENSFKNFEQLPMQQKQSLATPLSATPQNMSLIKGGSTPIEGYKDNFENFTYANNNPAGEKKLYASIIDQSDSSSIRNYNGKSNSPFDKKKLENNNVMFRRNSSFKDFLIEESENLEEGLCEKEAPKHSANVKTLQEIRGIDNRSEKLLPSIQQHSTQTNEQRIMQLINKYKIPDVTSSPSNNILDKLYSQSSEEEKHNDPNKHLTIVQLNEMKQQKIQQILTQPIKQIHVSLQQDQKSKANTPSQVLQLQQQHRYGVDSAQFNQKSPHPNQPMDIQTFRRATLDSQNSQLNSFSDQQYIKVIGTNNLTPTQQSQQDHSRNNNHKQAYDQFPSSQQQSQNAVIGHRINIHSSIEKNTKSNIQDNNYLPYLHDPLISTKSNKAPNIDIPLITDNSSNILTQYNQNQNRQSGHHIGAHRHSLNNPQFLQKAQFDQAYQNTQAVNFKNVQPPNQQTPSSNTNNLNFNHQNFSSSQSNTNSTSNSQLRGISLLSKQNSNSNQPTPNNQMNKQQHQVTCVQSQNGNMIIYRHHHPEESKQLDQTLKSGLHGVSMMVQHQNIHETAKPLSNINNNLNTKPIQNSRNHSPNIYQSNNLNISQNQLQSSPNPHLQKKLQTSYQTPVTSTQHNSMQYNLDKLDSENIALQNRMAKSSNNNYNYQNSYPQQSVNNTSNNPTNIVKGEQIMKGIESNRYSNLNSQINPSSITQQSSHLQGRVDQQPPTRLTSQQNTQFQQSPYLTKNPASFNIPNNIDNSNYYNQLQYQHINSSPKGISKINVNLSKLQGSQINDNLTQEQGTDRSSKNLVM